MQEKCNILEIHKHRISMMLVRDNDACKKERELLKKLLNTRKEKLNQ